MFKRGVEASERKDYATAFSLFKSVADRGVASAQFNVGLAYLHGLGVAVDYAQALSWFKKAADQGLAPAQVNLATMYYNGRAVPKDYAQALFWHRKAADQGNAIGQMAVGEMYENGYGVKRDNSQAFFWYNKAAAQGEAIAQNKIGAMYLQAQGVPQSDAQAVLWFRKSADQGNVDAQRNLGIVYQAGVGVEPDAAEAIKWFRMAADQGDAGARDRLAKLQDEARTQASALNYVCEGSNKKSFISVDPKSKTVRIYGGATLEYRESAKQYVRISSDVIEFGCKNAKSEEDVIADSLTDLIGDGRKINSGLTTSIFCLMSHKIDRHTGVWTATNNGNVTGSHTSSAVCTVRH